MAQAKFQMLIGMKEHPVTGELLYPGDVFECEEKLVDSMPQDGGWKQPVGWNMHGNQIIPSAPNAWGLVCAKRLPADVPEQRTMRAEPSKVVGINISEADYEKGQSLQEAQEKVIPADTVRPKLPKAKAAA